MVDVGFEPSWLPHSCADQQCVFCGATRPRWLHPFRTDRTRFPFYGKEHTLPQSWSVCQKCEAHVRDGDDAWLLGASKPGCPPMDVVVLGAFRQADLGGRRFPDA